MNVQIVVTWAAVVAPLGAVVALLAWSLKPALRATFGSSDEAQRHSLYETAMKRGLIAIPGIIGADIFSRWVWREPLDKGNAGLDALLAAVGFVILVQYLGLTAPRRRGGGRP
ncbi:MAG: hypothetical protein E6J41_28470 [Chloroflexi bacterium]|nr:MAG: hypothetical protein E6J41_28470 [Chloroflexota bacterium]